MGKAIFFNQFSSFPNRAPSADGGIWLSCNGDLLIVQLQPSSQPGDSRNFSIPRPGELDHMGLDFSFLLESIQNRKKQVLQVITGIRIPGDEE